MTSAFRAYLPVGGKIARRVAQRLFLRYGIRPRVIARRLSLWDRLCPLWTIDALPTALPEEVHLQALLDAAARERDDRPAVLYLCGDASLLPYLHALEGSFVIRHADGSPLSDAPDPTQEVST